MKKFLLLNSPIFWDSIKEKEQYLSPLGLGYIATYLDKLGTDEEARMTFEKDVKFLTNCSKQFKAQMKAQGREVVSDGWFCDENGNWGGWVITKNSDKSSFLKKMSDHTNEILEKKLAKKKGKACRAYLQNRFKGIQFRLTGGDEKCR